MSVIERNEHVWAIEFSNGWQYTPSIEAAEDAKRQGLNVVGYVPASLHRGAVRLSDAEWDRVVYLLSAPMPPGPQKDADVAIWRKINRQRGQ